MHSAKAVRPPKPTVIEQWNLFGGCDEIPINQPIEKQATTPAPAAPVVKVVPRIQTIVPAMRKSIAKPSPSVSQDLDFPLPGQRFDDGIVVNLEAIDPEDTPETLLAKRMFLRMLWDLKLRPEPASNSDLFGQNATTNQGELDQLDALIWMYSLNPDGSLVSFEWVCDVLGFNADRVRRVTGRSMRAELKRIVNLLSTIVSESHARECELQLSDYVDVSAWRT